MGLVLYLPTDIIFETSKNCYSYETFPLNVFFLRISQLILYFPMLWSTKSEALLVAEPVSLYLLSTVPLIGTWCGGRPPAAWSRSEHRASRPKRLT